MTGGGTAERPGHPRTPLWIAMIPPASTVQRICSKPARVHLLRQPARAGEAAHRLGQVGVGLGVAGEGAEQRHDAVEPERVEGRERRPRRLGDLEDRRARPPGLQDPGHLAQAAVEVGEVADAEADGDRVEALAVVGKLERVGPLEADAVGAALGRLLAGEVEHRLGEVAADHVAARGDPAGQLQRQVAGAAADVERRVAGAELGPVGGALAPAVVQAGGHHRVERVVATGDAVEHAVDLAREVGDWRLSLIVSMESGAAR